MERGTRARQKASEAEALGEKLARHGDGRLRTVEHVVGIAIPMLEALLDEVLDQRGLAIPAARARRHQAAGAREPEESSGELGRWRNRLRRTLAIPRRAVE